MLQLSFADKYQLWAELVQPRADRTFVPTSAEVRIADHVQIELLLAEVTTDIVLTATVVGLRPQSEKFGHGIFVSFAPKELEKCRALLGLLPLSQATERGRRTARVDCALPLHFTTPQMEGVSEAKNLSETGLLAKVGSPLTLGQRVTLKLTLDDGSPLQLNAEVSWSRPELKLVGLEFVALDSKAGATISAAIKRLSESSSVGKTKSIVVADDEPATLGLISGALKKAGYEVHNATRGDEALSLVRKLRPRLVILDVLLPAIDGKDLCRRFRADAEMVTSHVILASALDRSKLHTVAQDAGATDYVTKPIRVEELLVLVKRYVGQA
ncbi:MAG: response regulator [Myxococcaceae bacterium]